MADLLKQVKTALRIKSDAFDELELKPLIDACNEDLKRSGIETRDGENSEMLRLAVCIYCKAYFGNNPQRGEYLALYERYKQFLAIGEKTGG